MGGELNYMTSNPAKEVAYLESNNPDGFHTWAVEEIEQFEQEYPIGTKQRLAPAFLLYTGVRRSDVIRLGRQMVKYVKRADCEGRALAFREWNGRKKIVKEHHLPILPELQEAMDAIPSNHMTFLVTEFNKPYPMAGSATGSVANAAWPAWRIARLMVSAKQAPPLQLTMEQPSIS